MESLIRLSCFREASARCGAELDLGLGQYLLYVAVAHVTALFCVLDLKMPYASKSKGKILRA